MQTEIDLLLASQITVPLVLSLVPEPSVPNHQVVVTEGGLCTLARFAALRQQKRRDSFTPPETAYVFWWLVYAVFQMYNANVVHGSLCARNVFLERK